MARLVLMLSFAMAVIAGASPAGDGSSQGDVTVASPTDTGTSQVHEEEESAQLQNELISNYIKDFEEIRQQCSDDNLKQAMKVIKLLVMQRWVVTLEPNLDLLKDIMSLDGMGNLDDVNEDIIDDLKEMNTKSPVADAMKLYFQNKNDQIQEHFAKEKETWRVDREDVFNKVNDENDTDDKEELKIQLRYKTERFIKATFNNLFPPVAKTMAELAYSSIFDKHESEDDI